MENILSRIYKTFFFLVIALTIGVIIYCNTLKASIPYADTVCPVCGGDEVLLIGVHQDIQECRCYDCGVKFKIEL